MYTFCDCFYFLTWNEITGVAKVVEWRIAINPADKGKTCGFVKNQVINHCRSTERYFGGWEDRWEGVVIEVGGKVGDM